MLLLCLITVKYSSIWFNFWLIFWLIFCINFCIFLITMPFFWAFAQFYFDLYVSFASLLFFRAILFESLLIRAHRGSLLVFFLVHFLVINGACKLAHSSDIMLRFEFILKEVKVEFLFVIYIKKQSVFVIMMMWLFWVAVSSSSDINHNINSFSLILFL